MSACKNLPDTDLWPYTLKVVGVLNGLSFRDALRVLEVKAPEMILGTQIFEVEKTHAVYFEAFEELKSKDKKTEGETA